MGATENIMRVLFADDHTLVREGILPFLKELAPKVEVLEAEDLSGAVSKGSSCRDLDLILLDLRMPGMNGLSGISVFTKSHPGVPVVILSGHYNRKDVNAAIDAGASGYISKNIGGVAMINALRLVLSGKKYLPPDLSSENKTQEDPSIFERTGSADTAEAVDPKFSTLTLRESEVLRMLVDGLTNKQIANDLGLQEITIKIHVRNIYRKIEVHNRAQAVKYTLQSGWLKD